MAKVLDAQKNVIMIWGKDAVTTFLEPMNRSEEDRQLILAHTRVYQFVTFEETEAFRLGICETQCEGAKESCEITPEIFDLLQNFDSRMRSPKKRKVA